MAVDLLREMEGKGIAPNVISYSSAITACGNGGKRELAIGLLREMEGKGIAPNVISFNSAIIALLRCRGATEH